MRKEQKDKSNYQQKLLNHTQFYCSLGWNCLFLKPRGKTPATPNGSKDASSDFKGLLKPLIEEHPSVNLGIATGGESGLWVLDIDPRHGGDNALDELENQHGKLPPTPTVRTGSGGYHYFFKLPKDKHINNSAGKIGIGIDVRGEGGYVVAAPSIHPETRKSYKWLKNRRPDKVELAEAPDWLFKLAVAEGAKISRNAEAWFEVLREKHRAGAGQHETMLQVFGMLIRKLGNEYADTAVLLAYAWNQVNFEPPLSDSEMERLLSYILRQRLEVFHA